MKTQTTNSSLVLHPLSLPLPNEIQLGRTCVTSADQEFMQAIDAGMESS